MTKEELQLRMELKELDDIFASTDMKYSEYISYKQILVDAIEKIQEGITNA